jgi:hypothetical protein
MSVKCDFTEPPRTIEINTNQPIALGKVVVVGVSIYSTAAAALAILYDGMDISGIRIKTIGGLAGLSMQFTMEHGVLFEHGLFVTVDSALTFLSISYYTPCQDEVLISENGSD